MLLSLMATPMAGVIAGGISKNKSPQDDLRTEDYISGFNGDEIQGLEPEASGAGIFSLDGDN